MGTKPAFCKKDEYKTKEELVHKLESLDRVNYWLKEK